MSSGVLFSLNSLSTKIILASQDKKPSETRKNNKYCLLNSNASKEKGSQNKGIKKTNR